MAEDISAAFESIYHAVIDKFIELNFVDFDPETETVGNSDGRVKIRELVKEYFDRESHILDRKSGQTAERRRKFMDQTSPQGSILSPTFWRIFDKIFSQIYINSLQRELRAKFPCIAEISMSHTPMTS